MPLRFLGSLLLIASIGACDTTQTAVHTKVDPVGEWTFDEGTAKDTAPAENDGVATSAVPVSGVVGKALELTGWPSAIEIPSSSVYESAEITVAFWFQKMNASTQADRNGLNVEGLVWKALDTGTNRTFSFSISNAQAPFDLYLKVGDRGSSLTTAIVKGSIEPQVWYHVVGVIREGEISLYLDGELVDEVAFDGPVALNTAPIVVGRSSTYSFRERYFFGRVDELKLYAEALSAADVASIYHWEAPD